MEKLVYDGVFEGLHFFALVDELVASRFAVEYRRVIRILNNQVINVDRHQVAVLELAVHPRGICRHIGKRPIRSFVLNLAILVALTIEDIEAQLLADFVLVRGGAKGGKAVEQKFYGLRLQVVQNEFDEPLKILIGKGIACGIGTENIDDCAAATDSILHGRIVCRLSFG